MVRKEKLPEVPAEEYEADEEKPQARMTSKQREKLKAHYQKALDSRPAAQDLVGRIAKLEAMVEMHKLDG